MATDTRATMGTFVANKRAKKVFKINDHLAMTIAGGVAVAQKVVDILRVNSTLFSVNFNRSLSVPAAARLVANILSSNRESGTPLPLQLLIGGVDESGPHLISLDPYGSLTEEKCVSTGSGSPIAYGVLEDEYRENRSISEMIPVVIRAVDSAMRRDTASGDSFDVALVTEEGYRELSEEEKRAILNAKKERVQ